MRKILLALLILFGTTAVRAQTPPCNLSFTVTQQSTVTQTVQLNATTSFPVVPGSSPNITINWGDNTSQSWWQSHQHTYTNPGTYTVTLSSFLFDTLNNVMICSGNNSQQVVVAPPSCSVAIGNQFYQGNGIFSFAAVNIGGLSNSYTWDFGDGSPLVTGQLVTHQYSNQGTFTVTVTATGPTCQSTATSTVQNYFTGLDCSQLHANISHNNVGFNYTFYNGSTATPPTPGAVINRHATWNFGDGSSAVAGQYPVNHTYTSAGYYLVTLTNEWRDSVTNTVYCADVDTLTVHVRNVISGVLYTNNNPGSYKVWLIVHDQSNNTLTAVDSLIATGTNSFYPFYEFNDHPAGVYRTKAAPLAGSPAASLLAPTYYDSSIYWNTAMTINHNGQTTTGNHIRMAIGNSNTGPGFIGGNISQGANKGTGAGVPNLFVALVNTATQTVKYTYTDANGDYSFPNIPSGTYTVFPEALNYFTTAATNLSITNGQSILNGVNFKQTSSEIKPIPQSVNDVAANDMFSIYPNPTTGMMTMNWKAGMNGKAEVSVVDMTGRMVMSEEVKTSEASKLNIGHLTNGVYFIKVSNTEGQYAEKVVLQR